MQYSKNAKKTAAADFSVIEMFLAFDRGAHNVEILEHCVDDSRIEVWLKMTWGLLVFLNWVLNTESLFLF